MDPIDISSTDSESSDWDIDLYAVGPTFAAGTSNAGQNGSRRVILPSKRKAPINGNGNSFSYSDLGEIDVDEQFEILSSINKKRQLPATLKPIRLIQPSLIPGNLSSMREVFDTHDDTIGWSAQCQDTTASSEFCRDILDHLATPAERLRWRKLDDASLERHFNMLSAQLACVGVEVRDRWSISTKAQNRLLERLDRKKRQVNIRTNLIADLEEKNKEVIAKKKVVKKNNEFRRNVSTMESRLQELEKENSVLRARASKASVPEGYMLMKRVDWNKTTTEVEKLGGEVNRLTASHQADRETWMKERSMLQSSVDLLNDQNSKLTDSFGWVMKDGIKEFVGHLLGSHEFSSSQGIICSLATSSGYAQGVKAGYRAGKGKLPLSAVPLYDPEAEKKYDEALSNFPPSSYPYLEKLSTHHGHPLEVIRSLRPDSPVEE